MILKTRPKNTVFVLGAGVSVPFGFPSGKKLLQLMTGKFDPDAKDYRHAKQQHESMTAIVKGMANQPHLFDLMKAKLRDAAPPSIDSWLSHNKTYMDWGKIAISAIIGDAETTAHSDPYVPDDWYEWLFHAMRKNTRSLKELLKNKVSFVTFNYDRMLEWTLTKRIKNFYGEVPEDECDEAIAKILGNIYHVHGVLGNGDLATFDSINFGHINAMPHGSERNSEAISYGIKARDMAESIRIIGESSIQDAFYADVLECISEAQKLIFLGFGYDEENLRLLRVRDKASKLSVSRFDLKTMPLSDCPIVGSALGLGKALREDAEREFLNNIILGDVEHSCVPFCDEFVSVKLPL